MTIGLMATAAFLIIAIAAFRLQPTEKGTGGFSLVGQSAQPLFRDLRDPRVQSDLMGPDASELSGVDRRPDAASRGARCQLQQPLPGDSPDGAGGARFIFRFFPW